MINQQNDVVFIPNPTGIIGQHLGDAFYGYPGPHNWLMNGNFSHQIIADSGSNLYERYSNRFEVPTEFSITVSG